MDQLIVVKTYRFWNKNMKNMFLYFNKNIQKHRIKNMFDIGCVTCR